jgi:LCP family protein required for cell wall assembly
MDAQGRARRRKRLKLLVIVLSVLAVAATATAYLLGRQLVAPIDRIDGVFTDLDDRPTRPTSGPGAEAVNILLLGTDRRSETGTASAVSGASGAGATDALLLLHINADRDGVTIISVPRDSWVAVPGHGRDRINTAYSYGGASLAVQTVEKLTQVRVDHLAVVDWEGVAHLTDELGGVTVTVPETVYDSASGITWTAGDHELDGRAALAYLGQRDGLPGGDQERGRRMQSFLRVLMLGTLGRLSDAGPWEVYNLLRSMTNNLSVDDQWSNTEMAKLAWSLRDVDDSKVEFLSVPVTGPGWDGPESVVHLDRAMGRRLWNAVRADQVSAWLDDQSDTLTQAVP